MWQGAGELWSAVAAAAPDETTRSWTAADIQRRALRILLPKIARPVTALPLDSRVWEEGLPAESRTTLRRGTVARGRVDWPRTALGGWPPTELVYRRRHRRPDTVLANALAWGSETAYGLLAAAPSALTRLEQSAVDRLKVLAGMSDHPALIGLEPQPLAGDDLKALHGSGHPWRDLEAVASSIIALEEHGLDHLAFELLVPDPEMGGKLFHLGVCGEMVYGLQQLGCVVESVRPIGGGQSSDRPAFRTVHAGVEWELYFESAGVWRRANLRQPYLDAVEALRGTSQALSADLLLIDRRGRRALMLECKDSYDPTYVGRGGYHQATTYLVEAQGRLSDTTVSLTIGHAGAVRGISVQPLAGGVVGLAEAGLVAEVVSRFVRGEPLGTTL
ncbi:MAG: hypothetical protein H0U82_09315 [Actinobacteria bacterium]|nr:hypothetical protein [Actinomycetota bacterium]